MVPNRILASSLSPSAKLVYGLVFAFRKHGLKLTNAKIGERLGISARRVSEIISELLATKHHAIQAEYSARGRVLRPTQDSATRVEGNSVPPTQDSASPSIDYKEERLRVTKKTPSASRGADPRHDIVKRMILAAYALKNNAPPSWDGRAGKALKVFLDSVPSWSADQIGTCIAAFFLSDTNTALSPHSWIPRLPDYLGGPLDRYGKPKKTEDKYAGIERAFAKPDPPDGENLPPEPDGGGGFRLH